MKIKQAYRYELDPNNKQTGSLLRHCGVARFVYNWALAQRIALFNQNEGKDKFTDAMAQHRQLNALKKTEFPWMYEVSKCAPQTALRNLDRAFANFWRERKRQKERKTNRRVGFPKFKKKDVHDTFGLTGAIHMFGNSIQLPRLGKIRTKESTAKFKGHILSVTVSREADRWFVSLAVERERVIPLRTDGEVIGIDLGINSFAVVYDGDNTEHIYAPKPLNKKLKRLKRLSRCHSRKQKGSKNRRKSALCLAKLHRCIKNTRRDFLHKLSTSLAKTKRVIAIEDLNVQGMTRNHRLARSITDSGWGEFRRMLEYKTQWYGSELVVIDRFAPSSKTCSECGAVNESLTLGDRKWVCMSCGVLHERDENAARNIRQLGLEILNTESSSGINACGVAVRPVVRQADDGEAGSKHTIIPSDVISDKTCGTVDWRHPAPDVVKEREMAYKSYPWYCMVCDRWFKSGMGRAAHYRGKQHQANKEKLREKQRVT